MSDKIMSEPPRPGTLYKHFKGGLYIVHAIASHTETGEQFVAYSSYSPHAHWHWVRPLASWCEWVEDEYGGKIPRFQEVK